MIDHGRSHMRLGLLKDFHSRLTRWRHGSVSKDTNKEGVSNCLSWKDSAGSRVRNKSSGHDVRYWPVA